MLHKPFWRNSTPQAFARVRYKLAIIRPSSSMVRASVLYTAGCRFDSYLGYHLILSKGNPMKLKDNMPPKVYQRTGCHRNAEGKFVWHTNNVHRFRHNGYHNDENSNSMWWNAKFLEFCDYDMKYSVTSTVTEYKEFDNREDAEAFYESIIFDDNPSLTCSQL